jgi:DNA-binding NtrC family response regulator
MRPIFLVVDPPDPETLSTRKLVLESAKFNVLTAFTSKEAIEIAQRTPIDAAVLHERMDGGESVTELATELKRMAGSMPVIVVSPNPHPMRAADKVISSHDPIELVRLLQDMFHLPRDPEKMSPRPEPTGQAQA